MGTMGTPVEESIFTYLHMFAQKHILVCVTAMMPKIKKTVHAGPEVVIYNHQPKLLLNAFGSE